VYDRRLDGETLTFGHEGVLYRNSFVMYDQGSESLWVHVTGEAIKGPKKGSKLRFLPSEIVPWSFWRLQHPDTKVLLGEMVEGMMGSFRLQDRLAGYGLSVGEGKNVTLFRYAMLAKVPVLEAEVGGEPVVLTFDRRLALGKAFSAKHDGKVLRFDAVWEPNPASEAAEGEESSETESTEAGQLPSVNTMRDVGTGSLWDTRSGLCRRGPLAGARLNSLPATAWLGKRWMGFFPEGEVVSLPKAD